MKVKDGELLLIYDSRDLKDRETLGYAQAMKHHTVKELDIWDEMLTPRQLASLSGILDVKHKELVDRQSDLFQEEFQDVQMTDQDWLKSIAQNRKLLKTPIAVHENGAKIPDDPKELFAMDQQLQEEKNAQVKISPSNQK